MAIKVSKASTLKGAGAFQKRVTRALERTDKTQYEIAVEMGFEKATIITMFKLGHTRVPLERVPAFAKAVDEDPADLVRLWMQDHLPEAWLIIQKHIGMTLTQTECGWVEGLRKMFPDEMPPFNDYAMARLNGLKIGDEI